jgi:hypothetical protein
MRLWADADVGAALVMENAEDGGPNPVYPTRIGVATAKGSSEARHRPGGDLRQVRLRAVILVLDALRRALAGPG